MDQRHRVFGAITVSLRWPFRIMLATLVLLLTFLLWKIFLFPTSFNELLFRHRLKAALESGATEIRMADLARFDWEEVCLLHAYTGYFRHEKYHRMYPGQGHSEGDETLLFIKRDGSPTYFSYFGGMAGVHIFYARRTCWPRDEAIMTRTPGSPSRYSMINDLSYFDP